MPKFSNLKSRLASDDNDFVDFVTGLLQIDPDLRPTAKIALNHKFFDNKYENGLTVEELNKLKN